MICASAYLLVFIQNLLVDLGEKILLLQPLTFGGLPYDIRQLGRRSACKSRERHAYPPQESESVKPAGNGSLGSRPIWLIP
jgi:hypothetical protein